MKVFDSPEAGNSYGLQFNVLPNIIHLPDSTFVDLVVAPYDTDVTCILSVTACDELKNGVPVTSCTALIEPATELCSIDVPFSCFF